MHFSSDTEFARIARGLIDKTLPRPDWTHAAHFAVALWMLSADDINAFEFLPEAIRAYNDATGTANTDTAGYHETITFASLRAARSVVLASPPDRSLCDILEDLMTSEFGTPGWLLSYWTRERLFSTEARRAWTEPDIRPLPFRSPDQTRTLAPGFREASSRRFGL